MIWKFELYVDDAQTAKEFKRKIAEINPDIVVSVVKNAKSGQYNVRTSIERVGDFEDRKNVSRLLAKLYEQYSDKIKNESVTLKQLIRQIIAEYEDK